MSITLQRILDGERRYKVENETMSLWDKGVFLNELQRQGIVLSTNGVDHAGGSLVADHGLEKGTYGGTLVAITEMYSMIEEANVSHFDSRRFEPIIPLRRDLQVKKETYRWSDGKDNYPPHLDVLPKDQQEGSVGEVFDADLRGQIGQTASILEFLIPKELEDAPAPFMGPTLADCEKFNRENPSPRTDIMDGKNIGFLNDWYSDARFAQQHLSGVNPTTIETVPSEKVKAYAEEADKQGLEGMKKLLSEGRDLLIQDYSFFREATGIGNDEPFKNVVPEMRQIDSKTREPTGKFDIRYTGASVIIFELHEDGRLHPLAITLDYKGSLDKSITLFNRRLTPDEKGNIDEKDDWSWRYAKTCAQTADWARHEIAVHLNDTHLIEEAIIVATQRTIPEDHVLYDLLSPHWFRTLAVNAPARQVLVPAVIARLAGFGPSIDANDKKNRVLKLLSWSYKNFDFQGKYIPNDLKNRGFDFDTDFNKYRNYPYASCMYILWGIIRNFVGTVIESKYKSDKDVQGDPYISDWYTEIQTQGQITTFPTITSRDQLIDAITMCIHTASPQHTAVNYLQDYYYSFVPAKPAALCTPLPADLKTLQSYTEKELTAALPIGKEGPKWKDWLLSAQLPELLSYKVDKQYTLINYAKSLYNVHRNRTSFENEKFDSVAIKDAAALFYSQLKDCERAFEDISGMQTEGTIVYNVLQPEVTAVSILI